MYIQSSLCVNCAAWAKSVPKSTSSWPFPQPFCQPF